MKANSCQELKLEFLHSLSSQRNYDIQTITSLHKSLYVLHNWY